jgi:hypothetical protein
MKKTDSLKKIRGNENSPIFVIGDSLPNNEVTKNNLSEILDRRHVVYKSVIIPIKYYMNEYMISKKGLKLPNDYNNENDIFAFVNAFTPKFDENLIKQQLNSKNYKIILCMGKRVFDKIKFLFETEYEYPKISVTGKGIGELGEYFKKSIEVYKDRKTKGRVILPILHNSSNRKFHLTDRFIDSSIDNNEKYITYNEYIAEQISEIMINDPELKNFLVDLRNL